MARTPKNSLNSPTENATAGTHATAGVIDDLDLMAYADGEAESELAARIQALVELDDGEADGEAHALFEKLAGIDEVGEAMRTYLELEADRAEPALDGLWTRIESEIGAATQARREQATEPSPKGATATQREQEQPGLWSRLVEWMAESRGYFATGAIAAAAAAALVTVMQPPPPPISGPMTAGTDGPRNPTISVMNVSTPPSVENLEVTGGSASVFTLSGDDGDVNAGVIWLDLGPEDEQEGPI